MLQSLRYLFLSINVTLIQRVINCGFNNLRVLVYRGVIKNANGVATMVQTVASNWLRLIRLLS